MTATILASITGAQFDAYQPPRPPAPGPGIVDGLLLWLNVDGMLITTVGGYSWTRAKHMTPDQVQQLVGQKVRLSLHILSQVGGPTPAESETKAFLQAFRDRTTVRGPLISHQDQGYPLIDCGLPIYLERYRSVSESPEVIWWQDTGILTFDDIEMEK